MSSHAFDQAIALRAQSDGHWLGHTSAAYANMVGPFGGVTAAQALNAVLQHPERLGEPVSLTVNFAAALADGPFTVQVRAARTNR
jgi:acyl-CoA thioesterase